ncbi:MAG: HTH domain-containing protein, partial [Candidatus Firestonebacteria bacterium]|nr:HTH domain-containing protein [Candidatus Firestonebacteria bacterium]
MSQKINSYYITNDVKVSECILKVLHENPDKYVSGQNLGKSLSLSRTSINKYIKKLIDDGYVIERKTKLGYKLVSLPDLIAPYEVEGNPDTAYIGKKVYYF